MNRPLLPSGWPETLGRVIAGIIVVMPAVLMAGVCLIVILGGGR